MSTPIKQLHDNKNNVDFYPYTHADAVIGLEEKIIGLPSGDRLTNIVKFQLLTQSQYDSIPVKDQSTLYIITDV